MYILNRQIKVIKNERFYLLSLKLSAVNFIIVFSYNNVQSILCIYVRQYSSWSRNFTRSPYQLRTTSNSFDCLRKMLVKLNIQETKWIENYSGFHEL